MIGGVRGQWARAEAGLRELLDGQDDPGMVNRETVPVLALALAVFTPRPEPQQANRTS